MHAAKIQTFYRLSTAIVGDRWASVTHSFSHDGAFPVGEWAPADFDSPGVVGGVIQWQNSGSNISTPCGNAIALIVASLGHLGLQIGWQHVIISETDSAGVILDTNAFDVVYGPTLLDTSNTINTVLVVAGAAAIPSGDKLLQLPSAVLIDKRTSTPIVTSNGRRRYQAGRTYYAWPHITRTATYGASQYIVDTLGRVTPLPSVVTRIDTTKAEAQARGWDQAVLSTPNGMGVGDTITAHPIASYSIDPEVGTQKKRLGRDNTGSVVVR